MRTNEAYHDRLEEKVLQKVFHMADAEFWLQHDEGLNQRFGEMIRNFIAESTVDELKFILKDFKDFSKDQK